MAVSALADPDTSPLVLPDDDDERCVVLYEHALHVLPSWLDDPERCRALWAEARFLATAPPAWDPYDPQA